MKFQPKRFDRLFALLFIGYLVMGYLVAEQGRTIDTQRTLIQSLFADSLELNRMRVKDALARNPVLHPASTPAATATATKSN